MFATPILNEIQDNDYKRQVAEEFGATVHQLFPTMAKRIIWTLSTVRNNVNPYHNVHHMMCVANSMYGAMQGVEFTRVRVQITFLAAAFHDFHHSGGLLYDQHNIVNSLQLFAPWIDHKGVLRVDLDTPENIAKDFSCGVSDVVDILNVVSNLIRYTQFPYSDAEPPYSYKEEANLLRDMDRLSCEHPDWYQQIYLGLYHEMQTTMIGGLERTLTFQEFCWNQVQFVSTMPLYSSRIAGRRLPNAIKNARAVAALATTRNITDPMELVNESKG